MPHFNETLKSGIIFELKLIKNIRKVKKNHHSISKCFNQMIRRLIFVYHFHDKILQNKKTLDLYITDI